jgi:hypothetical protein
MTGRLFDSFRTFFELLSDRRVSSKLRTLIVENCPAGVIQAVFEIFININHYTVPLSTTVEELLDRRGGFQNIAQLLADPSVSLSAKRQLLATTRRGHLVFTRLLPAIIQELDQTELDREIASDNAPPTPSPPPPPPAET